MAALPALKRQHRPNFIDSVGRREWTMGSAVAWLTTGFPLALLSPTPFPRLARKTIGGRGFGGRGGILKPHRQLPLQIGDLLFSFRDLFFGFGDPLLFLGELLRLLAELFPQLLHLTTQSLVLAAQCLLIRRWTPLRPRSSMRGSHRVPKHLASQMFQTLSTRFPRPPGSTHLNCYLETKTGSVRRFGIQLKALLREAITLSKAPPGQPRNEKVEDLDIRLTWHLRDRILKDKDNQRLLDGIGQQMDRDRILTFLQVPGVEPTNNRAERMLRPAVIARKVSHCSKNERGAYARAAFLSVIQTARKNVAGVAPS